MNTRNFFSRVCIVACVSMATSATLAREEATHAQTLFEEAMRASQQGSQQDAKSLFAKSADAFESEARTEASAGRWYNAGNARLQAGETGRAIAAYLRAQALAPADTSIAANLDEARRTREVMTAPMEPRGIARVAPHWRFVDESIRAYVAIVGWAVLWCGVCALLMLDAARERARGMWKVAVTVGGVLACVAGLTIVGDRVARSADSRAVITAGEVLPRKGNGESFAAATEEPLRAGADCAVIATRPDWTEISLAGEIRGWVPSSSLERLW